MRLIDADAFKEYIKNGFQDAMNLFKNEEGRDVARQITEAFCRDIDEQPTAYDIDKVVEQLKERSKEFNSGLRLHGKPEDMLTDEAIEIVKAGNK
jgi:hypothetical protein|nr:MAG TPA: hypothetical protein [Caudoviricetes sp.]